MSLRNAPRPAAVYGVDIGKNIFHVVGTDSGGEPVQRARFRRDTLLQFFARAAPAIVGMESCAGSQWIARRLQALGHKVRLIPAQFVKPYVKSNKSDIIDAEAIAVKRLPKLTLDRRPILTPLCNARRSAFARAELVRVAQPGERGWRLAA